MFAALKSALGVGKQWPQYTRDDVAKHNTHNSLWIVADDKVYDVTDFIQLHPGGAVAVLKRGGGCHDCRQDYKFHSKGAREQWKKFQIGVLSEVEYQKAIPKHAAPSDEMLKAATIPLRYGGPAPSQPAVVDDLPHASVSMSRTDPDGDEDDGGEDCVAEGQCCRGGAPSAACQTCPHAPSCMKKLAAQQEAKAHYHASACAPATAVKPQLSSW